MNDRSENRMVKIAELWERTSAKGTRYFSGFMGDCQVLMFDGGEKEHPTRPGETVHVWRLMVQERDPSRRTQRPPAADAARGHQTDRALRDIAEAWSPEARDRHVQELSDRVQPDEEITF